ncbi:Copper transport outer membrane protein, MctB [Geodermatophilus obscurus]|uniref:Copper transport outer membrane protein, MctB n=1 Tax=Geodermatophilus obscurus TaxID=1861 RepID=A0A1M7SSA9_9ACTN|nr:copper transporter [Geodermatophilus obscurus]SHN61417.1 Copper transport outer membrane protein, MctB [Geodermatophilus obscurus]
MIDFRYHLVSLIAVFLAVALGIVIGTTALNAPILEDLEGEVAALAEDKRELETQTRELQAQLDTSDAFEQAVAPSLVAGNLAGRSVVLVAVGEDVATETVEEVTTLIGQAGGTVTGTVRLQPEYSDPATAAEVQSYVTGPGLPTGVTLPETDDTGQLVGSLLAQVLMRPAVPGAPAPDTAALSSVLAGLRALDVLDVESSSVTPADFAVLLTAGAPTERETEQDAEQDAAQHTDTLVDLALALDAAGSGAVVAGDAASAGDTGLVGVIRADPENSAAVSTVDNIDAASGRISTVLALGRESQGTSGAYGTGEDAQPVPPLPAATP